MDLVFSILAVLIVIIVFQQFDLISRQQKIDGLANELTDLDKRADTDLTMIRRAKEGLLEELAQACRVAKPNYRENEQIHFVSDSCDIIVKDDPQFQTLVFNESVLFDFAKSELKPEGIEALALVREVLSGRQDEFVEVQILGHTDNNGDEATNFELGYWRAQRVFDLLTKEDFETRLDPHRNMISVTTYGYYRPVTRNSARFSREALTAANKEQFDRDLNRRIELNVFYSNVTF